MNLLACSCRSVCARLIPTIPHLSRLIDGFGDEQPPTGHGGIEKNGELRIKSGTPAMPMPGPATPALWSVGGFTFDLTSSSVVPPQSANFLNITGTGFISTYTNLDRTPVVGLFHPATRTVPTTPPLAFRQLRTRCQWGPPPIVSWSTADAIPLPCVGVQPAGFAMVGSPSLSVMYRPDKETSSPRDESVSLADSVRERNVPAHADPDEVLL